jgi:hypothetical protein
MTPTVDHNPPVPTSRPAGTRSQLTSAALSSGRTSGSRKARYRTAARATSSKSGFRAFTAMSAVATRSPRAASPRSHCAGCSRRPSPLVFSLSQGAGSRARQERGLRRPRRACRDARFSDRALVVGRSSLGAALQLGQAKVGAPAQPGPAAHHPAKLAHPRIGLSTRWRLCEASAPDAIPTS